MAWPLGSWKFEPGTPRNAFLSEDPAQWYNGLQAENLVWSKFGVTRLLLSGKIVTITKTF